MADIRRCEWCGRFVRRDAEPIMGVNRFGEARTQLLCDQDAPVWLRLIEANRRELAGLPR